MIKKHLKKVTQKKIIILFYLYFICSYIFSQVEKPYVILVSFDGFRYDYAKKYQAKNFLMMAKEGVTTKALLPCYPSKTHPNHYSIITGLKPGHHGLVDNTFYNPNTDETFVNSNQKFATEKKWYGGVPLWQLVQKNGMKAASFFWIASEAPILGKYPDYYIKYGENSNTPNVERINKVMEWLDLSPQTRPNFITLYFSLVDDAGHQYGTQTEDIGKIVQKADSLLGYLRAEIKKKKLPINLIVVSDHGMMTMPNQDEHFLPIEDLADVKNDTTIQYVSSGFQTHIYVKDKKKQKQLLKSIKNSVHKDKYRAYLKKNTPIYWGYRDSDLVGDIIVEAKFPYYIGGEVYLNKLKKNGKKEGQHGYDAKKYSEMAGIFYAAGPDIIPQLKPMQAFENIDIYTLITQILGLKYDHKIDGKEKTWKGIYKQK
ncbi:MAG: alkaline phosphatase family protein [Bacteroidetes bacterium]|nr:MAG: alkaline phosphatase family protein [Bacteroidota bacterium]